jgi:hypothetical protein
VVPLGPYNGTVPDRAQIENDLEEIRARLAWVRDYL